MTTCEVLARLGGNAVIAAKIGVDDSAISHWRVRGIPPARWPALVSLAAERGCPDVVNWETLAALREAS